MIWLWWETSIFILIPHHPPLDGYLVFCTLSNSINTLTFLPTFTVILSTLWFVLRDATFSLLRPPIRFRTTFLLLLTYKFHPIIVGPSPEFNILSVSASALIWDHFSIVANLQILSNHSRTITKTIKYRKLQSINMEAFKADTPNSVLIRYRETNATELAQQYDSVRYTLIILHAPLITKRSPAILASKRYRRYLERVWRRNPSALNRSRLTRQTHLCNRQMSKGKSAHYSKIMEGIQQNLPPLP